MSNKQKDDFWTSLIKKIASLFAKSAGAKDGNVAKAHKTEAAEKNSDGGKDRAGHKSK